MIAHQIRFAALVLYLLQIEEQKQHLPAYFNLSIKELIRKRKRKTINKTEAKCEKIYLAIKFGVFIEGVIELLGTLLQSH